MGDPVTAGIIIAASVGVSGYAASQQGQAVKAQYKTEARNMELQQKQIESNTAAEELQRRRNLQNIISTQNAMFAGSGQSAGFGSAGAIQQDSLNQSMLELQNSLYNKSVQTSIIGYNISGAKSAANKAVSNAMIGWAGSTATSIGTNLLGSSFGGGGKGE